MQENDNQELRFLQNTVHHALEAAGEYIGRNIGIRLIEEQGIDAAGIIGKLDELLGMDIEMQKLNK